MEPVTSSGHVQSLEDIKHRLQCQIGDDRFQLWFGHLTRWKLEPNSVAIDASNPFLADCIKSFCLREIRSVVDEVLGEGCSIQIGCYQAPQDCQDSPKEVFSSLGCNGKASPNPTAPPKLGQEAKKESAEASGLAVRGSLNVYRGGNREGETRRSQAESENMKTDYWAEFIDGESNRMARTAAQMVIERPGTISPLFIHGPCGVGKTHLARGIVDQLRARHRLRRAIYLTAEQFTIDFTDSARGAGFASFRKKYRDIDALVVDDIQFLLGKGATLLELRNTVDNLTRNQRQVVFVADRSLQELIGLGNELHARVTGGMVCSMDAMDEASRLQLLQRLCHRHGIDIEPSAVESLVHTVCGDARILFGVAFRLMTAQRSSGVRLTRERALLCCADLLKACQPVVRMLDIEKAVCDVFGLEPKSLQAKSKSKTISQPRMLAMFLARKYTKAAYSEIGHYFGNRQHSTVISAQKKVEGWLAKDEAMDHSRGSVRIREMMKNLESALQVG